METSTWRTGGAIIAAVSGARPTERAGDFIWPWFTIP